MPTLIAFSPASPHPWTGLIIVIVAVWAFIRAWDFMAARRWRWTIAEWFFLTLCLSILLALVVGQR